MWNFSLFEEEDLISFLERGMLDSDIEELLNQWEELSPKVQYHLIKYLRSGEFEPELLQKALNIKHQTAVAFLKNPTLEFDFPAVDIEGGQVVRALALKDTPETFCNLRELKRHIKPVEEYLRSQGRLSEHISLFFEAPIRGNSFQLALALSLSLRELPPSLCWSGGVKKEGRLTKVDSLKEKAELCQSIGKRLADPSHFKNLQELCQWLEKPFVEVPLAVSKDPLRVEEFFKDSQELLNLKNILRLQEESLVLLTGKLEGSLWQEVAEKFVKRVKELDYMLMRRLKAHVVINGPASLAFALGILYGHTRPSVIYHYNPSSRRYHPIELENTREIKEHVNQYELVETQLFEAPGEDLSVVLFFAHHNPVSDIRAFLEKEGIRGDMLVLTTMQSRGNLSPELFKSVAKEIASAIQERKGAKHYANLHFFFSCPVAIAYLFGVAFGHFNKGFIYNYNKEGGYERVLSIELLRDLIEKAL
ncbi:MAG: SAVED domain-containing protein [Aquificaceae bacterium]|nr:SAVED domain-containing protein [Aquificaceae bacterium]